MAKGYWVSCYRAVHDADKLAAYAKLTPAAIEKSGGKFIIRGVAAKAYDNGVVGRTVIVEFDSVEAAIKARESSEYKAALDALGDGVDRDFRIVEGAA
jgi:uncharacterized protein (DUF1330 family)